jgi:hypothetical protein
MSSRGQHGCWQIRGQNHAPHRLKDTHPRTYVHISR